MIGTLINTVAILAGTALGLLLRKGIPERMRETVMQGLALCVVLIGVSGAIKTGDTMCVIVSMVVGGLLGSAVNNQSSWISNQQLPLGCRSELWLPFSKPTHQPLR